MSVKARREGDRIIISVTLYQRMNYYKNMAQ